jgi:hypothetical protein
MITNHFHVAYEEKSFTILFIDTEMGMHFALFCLLSYFGKIEEKKEVLWLTTIVYLFRFSGARKERAVVVTM